MAMKIMKWRGYSSDDALVVDIQALQGEFSNGNERFFQIMADLFRFRHKLCNFHVSKVFTNMRIASSIAESTHSAIKGGGELARVMRASNFYEALVQVLQLMHIYVDDTVRDLRLYAGRGWTYSPYVRTFMDKAWRNMARCSSVVDLGDGRWTVLEDVPELKETAKTIYSLPAYTRVNFIVCSMP